MNNFFEKADKENWAVGQFNFSTLTQLEGIVKAGKNFEVPLILGTSEGEVGFLGFETAVQLRDVFKKKTGLPLFLNLDHGKSKKIVESACESGYDMVHFDGSELPFEENIKRTKEVVEYAKNLGVLVEGEVGILGTSSSEINDFEIKEEHLTDPEEAEIFVKETGVDCLAVSIGNFHGIKEKGENPKIEMERLKDIKRKIGDVFLVLHGGSGISGNDIEESIKSGIVKINVNTELRKAFTENLRKILNNDPETITPYKYFPFVMEKVREVVENKIKLFYNGKLENNKFKL